MVEDSPECGEGILKRSSKEDRLKEEIEWLPCLFRVPIAIRLSKPPTEAL